VLALTLVSLSASRLNFWFCLRTLNTHSTDLALPIQATELKVGWISYVFARNYLLMGIMYGGWHWFLFESFWSTVMKRKKFHPKSPSKGQMNRDVLFTTLGFTQSSVWEVRQRIVPANHPSDLYWSRCFLERCYTVQT
jgi:hypothetical protein